MQFWRIAAILACGIGFLGLSFGLWRATATYRTAIRYGYNHEKLDVPMAQSERLAFWMLGVPSMLVYCIAAYLLLVVNFSLATYLAIGWTIYLLIPVRRIPGFMAARKISRAQGEPTRLAFHQNVMKYFREVWRPEDRKYTDIFGGLLNWVAPFVGSVLLWPLAIAASTYLHVGLVQGYMYLTPWWRRYST